MRSLRAALARATIALLLASLATAAFAQTPPAALAPGTAPLVPPIPTTGALNPTANEAGVSVDRELDIANIVTSAAKGVTTVQEAPAIITIITADEIRQRGYRELGQVLASIPGWVDVRAEGDEVSLPMVRGTVQAVLYLKDGVSFFDPAFNSSTMGRAVPLETIKRVEVITGPGGVLWGANSFMGIVNVITKDAEDVSGIEASAGFGTGKGDPTDFRAYAMWGKAFFKGKLKLMLHASYENFLGEQATERQYLAGSPTPQPVGPAIFGLGQTTSNIARSWLLNLDGKISAGPFNLYFNYPVGELNYALTFGPPVIVNDSGGNCDKGPPHCNRSTWNFYDRYAILEYRDRFFKDKLGIDAKAYYIQFNRDFLLRIFPSSVALPGGLSFAVNDVNAYRYGGTLDVDFTGPFSWSRLLAGAEVFHEAADQSTTQFLDPSATGLPLVCPLNNDGTTLKDGCPVPFLYSAERTVVGLFAAAQVRPIKTLTLDGGVRYQQGFGGRAYDPQVLGSAAAVWQFAPDLHLKINFSQGFRPPVFNNTDGNGGSVQFAGNPNLKVERSEAYQAEVNARLLKGVKKIRELQLRLDYAYTLLDNVIVVRDGQYENSGRRAIQSVEFLARLYLQGDHFLSFSYTFNQITTSDNGEFRSVPQNYFQLGAVFNIIKEMLDLNMNLTVLGGMDDPNRYPTGSYTLTGSGGTQQGVIAPLTAITYDRLPPVALLQLGLRLRIVKDHLWLGAQFYNVLNQSYYYPDVFFDQTPVIELRPNPAPLFSFFSNLTFKY